MILLIFTQFCKTFTIEEFDSYEAVITEGELSNDKLYFIIKGEVGIFVKS